MLLLFICVAEILFIFFFQKIEPTRVMLILNQLSLSAVAVAIPAGNFMTYLPGDSFTPTVVVDLNNISGIGIVPSLPASKSVA